ncbi:MAG: BCCT family transporter, partial [Clostridiales bacterium]
MGTNEKSKPIKPKPIKQKLAPWVFFPPLIFILALCIWVVSDPIRAGESLSAMFSFVTNQLGWYFELYIFAVVLICIYLCI